MFTRKFWLCLCLFSLLACGACSHPIPSTPVSESTQVTQTPISSSQPTATPQPDAIQDFKLEETTCPLTLPAGAVEGENIICYTISVPELHEVSVSRYITLTLAVVKSVQQPSFPDPLFMLAGGPGQSTLKTFIPMLFSTVGEGLRAYRDVVLVEQRGTLYSSPYLYCDEITAMNLDLMGSTVSKEERKMILEGNVKSCYVRLSDEGINLSAYNSLENAADIAAVAGTLGYESVNLYGGSYGTMLAQHLMREYPQLIRSVILDSIAPLRHDPNVLHKAASFDRSLRLLFTQCKADPACNSAYPSLESLFFKTVARLNQKPVTVELTNPQTGTTHPLLLTGDKFVEITRSYLYLTPLLPSLPKMLFAIVEGQYDELAFVQSKLTFDQDLADGMYKSVVCSELVDFGVDDFADDAELYPDITRVMTDMLSELWIDTCQIWEVNKLDESVKSTVTSDIPTLLLSGIFDPTTPPSLVDIASEQMSHAYSITFSGVSHGVLGTSECATDIMLRFYGNPSTPPGHQCIEDLPHLAFEVPSDSNTSVTMAPITVDVKGVKSVAPEGWSELQPGLFVRGKSALDQTLMIFDVVPDQAPDVFVPGLLQFLNIEEFPGESTSTLESNGIAWNLYRINSTINGIDISPATALGQDAQNAYVVVLMVGTEESDRLYESAFLPAVEALEPTE